MSGCTGLKEGWTPHRTPSRVQNGVGSIKICSFVIVITRREKPFRLAVRGHGTNWVPFNYRAPSASSKT